MSEFDCAKAKSEVATTVHAARKFFDKRWKKERSDETQAWSLTEVGEYIMRQPNLTINWDLNSDTVGFETIWEYIAGECYGRGQKPRVKIDRAMEYAHVMKNGIMRLKERLFEEWGTILYIVPRTENSRNIEVITLNGDFVVNESGQTAREIYFNRGYKGAMGQVRSVYNRTVSILGNDKSTHVRERIVSQVQETLNQPLPSLRQLPPAI